MDKKGYAELLKSVFQMQKYAVAEEIRSRLNCGDNVEFLEGVVRGLEIAMEKIDASMFLTEK